MKQLTMVSFYGQKQNELQKRIQQCTDIILDSEICRVFRPYRMGQIHGTIVGMEKRIGFKKHYNANIWWKDGVDTEMKFDGLVETVEKNYL